MTEHVNGLPKTTPPGHVIHPDCRVQHASQHGFHRAHHRGCRCPGPSLDAYRAAKTAEWERRKQRALAGEEAPAEDMRVRTGDSIPIKDPEVEARFSAMPAPSHDADAAERAFYQRDDLRCRDFDPELWFPVGTGPEAKRIERAARSICGSCTAQTACLSVALSRNDVEHGVIGGYNPAERRRMIEFARFQVAS